MTGFRNAARRSGAAPLALAAMLGFLAHARDAAAANRSPDSAWEAVASEANAAAVIGEAPGDPARPSAFRVYAVDVKALDAALASAPLEADVSAAKASSMLTLPMPDGSFARFRIVESPILGPDVQARIPAFRSYLVQGVDDPTANGRLDAGPYGFHAYINTQAGAVVIDPWRFGSTDLVLSARLADCPGAGAGPGCGVEDFGVPEAPRAADKEALATGSQLHIYRLALVGTDEYFAFFDPAGAAGTSPKDVNPGVNAMAAAVNRANAVFEVEAAIRLQLTAVVGWWGPGTSDPFPAGNTIPGLYTKVQPALDSIIGNSAYDIGHGLTAVSPTEGFLGAAALESGCVSDYKAGAASGSADPASDHFVVGTFCHELGHQFASRHTFSNVGGCISNPYDGWKVEPESGSTIMSYAGACSTAVQPYADPYFHRKSLEAIHAFRDATTCAVVTATGNTPPVVDGGPDGFIPTGTPFYVAGSATDADGDVVTSNWETMSQTSWIWDPDYGRLYTDFAPYRSVLPTTAGSARTIPGFSHVLDGTSSPFEQLPTDSTSILFAFTARDNRAGGGGVAFDSILVTAGGAPFFVNAPNGGESFHAGQPFTATWTVGGSGAIAANVGAWLLTENGTTYIGETANDGSASFIMPCGVTSSKCRLLLEGVTASDLGVHFYDISNADFTLTDGLPDYVPYTPGGWADAITVNSADAPTFGSLLGDTTTYLYAAYANNSTSAACGGFAVDIRVDDAPVALWSWGNAPGPGAVWGGGPYTPVVNGGRHTAWFLTDPQGAQPEVSESNNGRARQFVWQPATVAPETQQARPHPPVRNAGIAWLPAGTPVRDNVDGLRLAPANGWWRAAAVSSTDPWQDADIRLYTPSTGTGNGFDTAWLAASATGGAYTDAVISNRNSVGNPTYDVGLLNSNGGQSGIGFEYRESDATMYFGDTFTRTVAAGQMLRMEEVSLNSNQGAQFTIEVQTTGASQQVWLMAYRPSTTVGGLWQTDLIAHTNAAGRALLPITVSPSGFYGIAVARHAFEGTSPFSYTMRILPGLVTAVPDTPGASIPIATRIEGAYPNPFNPQTRIQLALRTSGEASVKVYDVQGRLVRTLVDAVLPAGRRDVVWDGVDDAGRAAPSGVYFVRLRHPDGQDQRRVSLVK